MKNNLNSKSFIDDKTKSKQSWTLFDIKENNKKNTNKSQSKYIINSFKSRHLLDIYADSLRYVNKLYNKKFNNRQRKVPGHMAHMIDKSIINRMMNEFMVEFDITSSNRFRTSNDMQYSFSYFYFLMNEKKIFNLTQILKSFDTDDSK